MILSIKKKLLTIQSMISIQSRQIRRSNGRTGIVLPGWQLVPIHDFNHRDLKVQVSRVRLQLLNESVHFLETHQIDTRIEEVDEIVDLPHGENFVFPNDQATHAVFPEKVRYSATDAPDVGILTFDLSALDAV